jgi:hypothetical protein
MAVEVDYSGNYLYWYHGNFKTLSNRLLMGEKTRITQKMRQFPAF